MPLASAVVPSSLNRDLGKRTGRRTYDWVVLNRLILHFLYFLSIFSPKLDTKRFLIVLNTGHWSWPAFVARRMCPLLPVSESLLATIRYIINAVFRCTATFWASLYSAMQKIVLFFFFCIFFACGRKQRHVSRSLSRGKLPHLQYWFWYSEYQSGCSEHCRRPQRCSWPYITNSDGRGCDRTRLPFLLQSLQWSRCGLSVLAAANALVAVSCEWASSGRE